MDKREWQKIEGIIDEALEYNGKARTDYINKKCSNDQQLREKVIQYLSAIEESKGFLEDLHNN